MTDLFLLIFNNWATFFDTQILKCRKCVKAESKAYIYYESDFGLPGNLNRSAVALSRTNTRTIFNASLCAADQIIKLKSSYQLWRPSMWRKLDNLFFLLTETAIDFFSITLEFM